MLHIINLVTHCKAVLNLRICMHFYYKTTSFKVKCRIIASMRNSNRDNEVLVDSVSEIPTSFHFCLKDLHTVASGGETRSNIQMIRLTDCMGLEYRFRPQSNRIISGIIRRFHRHEQNKRILFCSAT